MVAVGSRVAWKELRVISRNQLKARAWNAWTHDTRPKGQGVNSVSTNEKEKALDTRR